MKRLGKPANHNHNHNKKNRIVIGFLGLPFRYLGETHNLKINSIITSIAHKRIAQGTNTNPY